MLRESVFSWLIGRECNSESWCENAVDAEIIAKLIPQTIFGATEAVTQIKQIPQEIFLCNRLAIARLHCTQEHPRQITQINSAENIFVYMKWITFWCYRYPGVPRVAPRMAVSATRAFFFVGVRVVPWLLI